MPDPRKRSAAEAVRTIEFYLKEAGPVQADARADLHEAFETLAAVCDRVDAIVDFLGTLDRRTGG